MEAKAIHASVVTMYLWALNKEKKNNQVGDDELVAREVQMTWQAGNSLHSIPVGVRKV